MGAEVTTFGDNVAVSIYNQSDTKLSNVSLILCLHFTDMHRDDYATFKMDKSLPALEPNSKNSFGKLAIDYELFGTPKDNDDIVNYRAVLISNEAVTWVDSNEFRLKRIKEELSSEAGPGAGEVNGEKKGYLESLGLDGQKIRESILDVVSLSIDNNLVGSDKVQFKVPRAIALLKPVFRMSVADGEESGPLQNLIKGENVDLVFKKGSLGQGEKIKLKVYSRYVNATLTFEGTETDYKLIDVDLTTH